MVSPRHNLEFIHVFGLMVGHKKWWFQNENLPVFAGDAARSVRIGGTLLFMPFNWLAFKASESP